MEDSQEPSFLHSLICFGGVMVIVIAGMLLLDINLHSLLVIALIWVASHSAGLGYGFNTIKSAMIAGIQKGLGAIFIFFLIGILVAALIESGTIGGLIYYGLDLLPPNLLSSCWSSALQFNVTRNWHSLGNDRYDWRRTYGPGRRLGYSATVSSRNDSLWR